MASPSASSLAVRASDFFDAHDAYLLYVKRIFATPLPPKGQTLKGEPGGVSFPDSILSASAKDASGMTIVAAVFDDVLAELGAQEDLRIAVQRMDHQIQDLARLCLKLESFRVCRHGNQCSEAGPSVQGRPTLRFRAIALTLRGRPDSSRHQLS